MWNCPMEGGGGGGGVLIVDMLQNCSSINIITKLSHT